MKLHELLAVEGNLEAQAVKVGNELAETFKKSRHLFEEKTVVFTPVGEGTEVTESQSNIQTNVMSELREFAKFLNKSLDASAKVATTNCVARADVVIDGADFSLIGIPATCLLELEKRVQKIRELVESIPTLDPAKGFAMDESRALYKAREVTKKRTKKIEKPLVLYDATKEHPAQVKVTSEDVEVGTIREMEWSGLITPVEKSAMLARADEMIRAIRAARSRANEADVEPIKIGSQITGYIFG